MLGAVEYFKTECDKIDFPLYGPHIFLQITQTTTQNIIYQTVKFFYHV